MPDGTGGAAIGAGGGAVVGAVMYALNQFLGSGRAVKGLDTSLTETRTQLEKDLAALMVELKFVSHRVSRIHDWHDVSDPEDPAGKIWYFSVALRTTLKALTDRVGRLVDLIDKVVRRFDQYNATTEKLITVVEGLQKDVQALGLMVANLDDRRR